MKMREKFFVGTAVALSIAAASTASAQEFNTTLGTIVGSPVTTDVGDPVITQTGDSTVDPYQNTITSEQTQTVTSTGSGSQGVSTTINGITYFGFMNTSGEGSQDQVVTESQVNQYDPTNVTAPPTVVSTSTSTDAVGSPTVTAVSATGFVGSAPRYSSTLTTGEEITDNSVVATQNSSLLNSAGITFEQRIGTATYDPTTGEVTVALPETATSSTNISATGITTTGAVSAATVNAGTANVGTANIGSITMVGGEEGGDRKIHNLAAGTATGDAVNVGQLNTAIAGVTTSINSLATLVEANRKRSDAGIATAVALSGGMFLPGKKINITANVGAFRDEVAIAGQIGILVSDNVALNAGVSTSFHSYGGTSVRGGVTFGF